MLSKPILKAVALLVALTLSLPNPALALRTEQTESQAGLEEIRRALEEGPNQLLKLASAKLGLPETPATPVPMAPSATVSRVRAAGLEEAVLRPEASGWTKQQAIALAEVARQTPKPTLTIRLRQSELPRIPDKWRGEKGVHQDLTLDSVRLDWEKPEYAELNLFGPSLSGTSSAATVPIQLDWIEEITSSVPFHVVLEEMSYRYFIQPAIVENMNGNLIVIDGQKRFFLMIEESGAMTAFTVHQRLGVDTSELELIIGSNLKVVLAGLFASGADNLPETGEPSREFLVKIQYTPNTVLVSIDGKRLYQISRANAWEIGSLQERQSLSVDDRNVAHTLALAPLVFSNLFQEPGTLKTVFALLPSQLRAGGSAAGLEETLKEPSQIFQEKQLQEIEKVAFDSQGRLLSASLDGKVRSWDLILGQSQVLLKTPFAYGINLMSVDPKGRFIASASSADNTVWLWDSEAGQGRELVDSIPRTVITSIAFHPDGKILAAGGRRGEIWLWDVNTGDPIELLSGHTDWITDLAFDPNGKMLISASHDDTLRFWNLKGKELREKLPAKVNEVWSLALSPDGKTLAYGGRDQSIHLWQIGTGKGVPLSEGFTLKGHKDLVRDLAFSPDGSRLASSAGYSDKTVQIWEVASGRLLGGLSAGGWVRSIAFLPDGKTLAGSVNFKKNASIQFWKVGEFSPAGKLRGQKPPPPEEAQPPYAQYTPEGLIHWAERLKVKLTLGEAMAILTSIRSRYPEASPVVVTRAMKRDRLPLQRALEIAQLAATEKIRVSVALKITSALLKRRLASSEAEAWKMLPRIVRLHQAKGVREAPVPLLLTALQKVGSLELLEDILTQVIFAEPIQPHEKISEHVYRWRLSRLVRLIKREKYGKEQLSVQTARELLGFSRKESKDAAGLEEGTVLRTGTIPQMRAWLVEQIPVWKNDGKGYIILRYPSGYPMKSRSFSFRNWKAESLVDEAAKNVSIKGEDEPIYEVVFPQDPRASIIILRPVTAAGLEEKPLEDFIRKEIRALSLPETLKASLALRAKKLRWASLSGIKAMIRGSVEKKKVDATARTILEAVTRAKTLWRAPGPRKDPLTELIGTHPFTVRAVIGPDQKPAYLAQPDGSVGLSSLHSFPSFGVNLLLEQGLLSDEFEEVLALLQRPHDSPEMAEPGQQRADALTFLTDYSLDSLNRILSKEGLPRQAIEKILRVKRDLIDRAGMASPDHLLEAAMAFLKWPTQRGGTPYGVLLKSVNHVLTNAGNNPRIIQTSAPIQSVTEISDLEFWIVKEGQVTEILRVMVHLKDGRKVPFVINVAKDNTEATAALRRTYQGLMDNYLFDPAYVMEPFLAGTGIDLGIMIGEWVDGFDELHVYSETGPLVHVWKNQEDSRDHLLSQKVSDETWYRLIWLQAYYTQQMEGGTLLKRLSLNTGDLLGAPAEKEAPDGPWNYLAIWDNNEGSEELFHPAQMVYFALLENAVSRDKQGNLQEAFLDKPDLAVRATAEGIRAHFLRLGEQMSLPAEERELNAQKWVRSIFSWALEDLPRIMTEPQYAFPHWKKVSEEERRRVLDVLRRGGEAVERYLKQTRLEKLEHVVREILVDRLGLIGGEVTRASLKSAVERFEKMPDSVTTRSLFEAVRAAGVVGATVPPQSFGTAELLKGVQLGGIMVDAPEDLTFEWRSERSSLKLVGARLDAGGGSLHTAKVVAHQGKPFGLVCLGGGLDPAQDPVNEVWQESLADPHIVPFFVPERDFRRRIHVIHVVDGEALPLMRDAGRPLSDEASGQLLRKAEELMDHAPLRWWVMTAAERIEMKDKPGFFRAVMEAAHRRGIPVWVDFRTVYSTPEDIRAVLNVERRRPMDVLAPNAQEFIHVLEAASLVSKGEWSGKELPEAKIIEYAQELRERYNLEGVLVKRDRLGFLWILQDRVIVRHGAKVEVASEIGAGDSLNAGCVLGLADGKNFEEAADLGLLLATATVILPGSQVATPESVKAVRPLLNAAGLEEENLNRILRQVADSIQGSGVVVFGPETPSRTGLEELVRRAPPELLMRMVFLVGAARAAQLKKLNPAVQVVPDNDVKKLAALLISLPEADRVTVLGTLLLAQQLQSLLPPVMAVSRLDPVVAFRLILAALGVPDSVLDQVDTAGLEESLARAQAA